MSDLLTNLAENQKETLKSITPAVKKPITLQNLENSDYEPENVFPNTTSTPIETKAATSKTTPVNSRNMMTGVLNDSTNQPTKKPKQC